MVIEIKQSLKLKFSELKKDMIQSTKDFIKWNQGVKTYNNKQ